MSPELRLCKAFEEEQIGNRSPSQILRSLRALAGPELLPEQSLRVLWLRKLPDNIRSVVAAHQKLTLRELAETADEVATVLSDSPSRVKVEAVKHCCQEKTRTPTEDNMKKEAEDTNTTESAEERRIEWLEDQVARLNVRLAEQQRASKERQRQQKEEFNGRDKFSQQWCWYHRRFGEAARRCDTLCSYPNAADGR